MINIAQSVRQRGLTLCLSGLFCLLIGAFSAHAERAKREGTFEKPDFAYPQTVIKTAEPHLKTGIPLEKVRAAIQTTIAANGVTPDDAGQRAALLDSLAAKLPQPFQSLTYLLEAQLYSDIYSQQKYTYDRRSLPDAGAWPENPMEWSSEMFKKRIFSLLKKTVSDISTLNSTPITVIAPLLEPDLKEYHERYPSVGAFITAQVMQMAHLYKNADNTIPFGKNTSSEFTSFFNNLIDTEITHSQSTGNIAAAIEFTLLKAQTVKSREQYLLDQYRELYSDAPEGVRLLDFQMSNKQEVYNLLTEATRKFSGTRYGKIAERELCFLTKERVDFSVTNKNLSTDSIKIGMTVDNLNNFYLVIAKYDPKKKGSNIKNDIVSVTPITVKGEIPFTSKIDAKLPNPGLGEYQLWATLSDKKDEIYNHGYGDLVRFSVCDLVSTTTGWRNKQRIYVTDGQNFTPIKGANVSFTQKEKNTKTVSVKTNQEGYVALPDYRCEIKINRGADSITEYHYPISSTRHDDEKEKLQTSILTDLSIYHLGDTVNYVGVAYYTLDNERKIAANRNISIKLKDANYKNIETTEVTTDSDGRFTGQFIISKDLLLGWCSISGFNKDGRGLGSTSFEVADYKVPTFFVQLDDVNSEDGEVIISGFAQTYSGMPLPGAKVNVDIKCVNTFRFMPYSGEKYTTSTTTDRKGKFTIKLLTEGLKDTQFEQGAFSVSAAVTSSAGETQTSPNKRFALGKSFMVSTNRLPEKVEATGEDMKFNVPVLDLTMHEVPEKVDYTIVGNNGVVLIGSFVSPNLNIKSSELPSGKYAMTFSISGDTTQYKGDVIVYRADDKKAPYKTPLWVPQNRYTAKAGEKNINIRYGSAYTETNMLCIISNSKGIIREEWLRPGDNIQTLKAPVPGRNEVINVQLYTMHNLQPELASIHIYPTSDKDSLSINSVTFRDKIQPGQPETWKFAVRYNGKPATAIPVMAVMSDKALNSIAGFDWSQNFIGKFPYRINNFIIGRFYTTGSLGFSQFDECAAGTICHFAQPAVNLYNQSLLPYMNYMRTTRYYSKQANGAMVTEEAADEASADSVMPELAESKSAMSGGASEGSAASEIEETLSECEHPLAFFKPNLVTDSSGEVAVSFVAPEYNTTWSLQIAAYTPDLVTDVKSFEIVASKPVMVRGNYPRFLRTGDKATISATLMNNTDEAQMIGGEIEIYDVASGKCIKQQTYSAETVAGKESRTVTIEYDVTDEYNEIGVKCYAIGPNHKDGERDIIGILPSSTPVREATDFYLGSKQNSFSTTLPKYDASANVTFEYCDNPIWYCVTALPAITMPESASIFTKLNALFGNVVAAGLAKHYPQIPQAIKTWRESNDSILVSNLAKNSDINLTPWVNNAESETARMQNLVTIFDTKATEKAIASLIKELREQQKPDGGWSWVPEMKSSAFVTSAVLRNIAWLKEMNFMPEQLKENDECIVSGVNYMDKQIYDAYVKNKRKIGVESALSWLSVRNNFDVKPATADIATCIAKALETVKRDWRKLDIYGKASAAILLASKGDKITSESILESLRQNAVVTPSSGMYYDNVGSGWNGYNRLQTTAQVLNAFAKIAPTDESVDLLRQWLILQRQVQDWGYSAHTAGVVYSILNSGTYSFEKESTPTLSIGDRNYDITSDNLTGSVTLTLNPAEISGKVLKVSHSGKQPAWGGVISQYVAPIVDVKPASVSSLSVTKQIVPIEDPNSAPKVGSKVRVILTLKTNKDLQYIEVKDDRGACLEPVDQLSSYTLTDGVWVYREVRNTATNLFIGYLPKGVHQISYECYTDRSGKYTTGIATATSLYAPVLTAHSAGEMLNVK